MSNKTAEEILREAIGRITYIGMSVSRAQLICAMEAYAQQKVEKVLQEAIVKIDIEKHKVESVSDGFEYTAGHIHGVKKAILILNSMLVYGV